MAAVSWNRTMWVDQVEYWLPACDHLALFLGACTPVIVPQTQWEVWPSSVVKLPWPPLRCFIVACTAIGLYKQCTQSVGCSFTDELPCTEYIPHHCTLSNSAEVHVCISVTNGSVAVGVWGWVGEYGVYTFVQVWENLEKWTQSANCILTSIYAREKLAYTCLEVDIHCGLLYEHFALWEMILLVISVDGIWPSSWQCTLHTYTKWTTYQVGQQCLTFVLVAHYICEQLCWLMAPLNAILDKHH